MKKWILFRFWFKLPFDAAAFWVLESCLIQEFPQNDVLDCCEQIFHEGCVCGSRQVIVDLPIFACRGVLHQESAPDKVPETWTTLLFSVAARHRNTGSGQKFEHLIIAKLIFTKHTKNILHVKKYLIRTFVRSMFELLSIQTRVPVPGGG